jgi:outer membrane protein assembly factor BamB
VPPGALVERFEVTRTLGAGGMAVVYLARDRHLEREVALKLIRAPTPLLLHRFAREGQLLAGLEHENVVRLYDVGVADGVPYMVMELVRGKTLSLHLAAGRPTYLESARVMRDVLLGVAEAHARGIVHRDLKPANIYLDRNGRAKVADFGLAFSETSAADVAEARAQVGSVMGTPGYMAPEQARGEPVGPEGDVYAIGVIFHEMLTGRKLFTGDSAAAILCAQTSGVPPPPSAVHPGVPHALDDLVSRALAPDAGMRPTVQELATSLAAWLDRAAGARRAATGAAAGGAVAAAGSPYRLLVPFAQEDSALFFGRDAEVAELADLVDHPRVRVVSVFGPCGIGKSSLLAAGLVARLDPTRYEAIAMTAGADPLSTLRGTLAARAAAGGIAVGGRPLTRDALALEPSLVRAVLDELGRSSGRTPVLILDQLEEVFTHNPRGSPRASELFDAVALAVEDLAVRVKMILSFRSEFRADMFSLEDRLAAHHRAYALREIDASGLAEAIEGPSHLERSGFSLAPGFAAELASELVATTRAGAETVLPVMQIVCHQLHDRMRSRGRTTIDSDLYRTALGGAQGALRRYVEERLAAYPYARRAALARQMLQSLTVKEGAGERFARARDEDEALDFPDRDEARRTLEHLIADHLVTRESAGGGDRRTVRLASEVICPLIDEWVLAPDAAERAARLLARAHRSWQENGERPEDLLDGGALRLVGGQLPSLRGLGASERRFVQRSIETRRRRLLFGGITGSVAAIALALMAYVIFLWPGELHVESDPPGARVLLDGRELGTTPLAWTGRPGRYRLDLRRERCDDARVDVSISGGRRTAELVRLTLHAGMLSVVTDPQDAACVAHPTGGGASGPALSLGRTPVSTEVPSGEYTLVLARDGYITETVRGVRVGDNRAWTRRRIPLVRNAGWLVVRSPHGGGTLSVRRERARERVRDARADEAARADDEGEGAVPEFESPLPRIDPRELAAGRYRLTCTRPGARVHVESVEIAPGTTTTATAWMPDVRVLWTIARSGGTTPPDLAFADLDADGIRDAVLASGRGGTSGIEAYSGRRGNRLWHAFAGSFTVREESSGDLDADGGADVVALAQETGEVVAISGMTGARLGPPTAPGAPRTPLVASLAVVPGDLDGKPGADVILAAAHGGRTGGRTGASGAVVTALSGRSWRPLWSRETSAVPADVAWVVTLPDVDGDGTVDLVFGLVPEARAGMSLAAVSGRTGSALWELSGVADLPAAPRPGDLDGDGRADLLIVDDRERPLAVSGARGTVLWRASGPADAGVMAVADLDGDGTNDAAHATPDGRVEATSRGRRLWATPALARRLAALIPTADVDGDGGTDLLARDAHGRVHAIGGRSGRALWRHAAAPAPAHEVVAVPDLDGDGASDAVVAASGGPVVALSGRTGATIWNQAAAGPPADRVRAVPEIDGTSGAGLVVLAGGALTALSGKATSPIWACEVDGGAWTPASLADLDGDAVPDVIVGTVRRAAPGSSSGSGGAPAGEGGRVLALSGRSGAIVHEVDLGSPVRARVLAADCDGDGAAELIAGTSDGRVVALAAARGRSPRPLWTHSGSGVAGDLAWIGGPGPAPPDVLVRHDLAGARRRWTALAAGSGTVRWSIEGEDAAPLADPAVDLDRDGRADLLVGLDSRTVAPVSGSSGKPLWTATLRGAPSCVPCFVELDSDGIPDIVTGSVAGDVVALAGRDGRLLWRREPPRIAAVAGSGDMSRAIAREVRAAGDVDRDGTADVVVASDREIVALSGHSGGVVWRVGSPATTASLGVHGDLDRDGVPDPLLGRRDGAAIAISGARGTVLWTVSTRRPVAGSAMLPDVDSDGTPDVLVGPRTFEAGVDSHVVSGRTGRTLQVLDTLALAGGVVTLVGKAPPAILTRHFGEAGGTTFLLHPVRGR